MVVLVDTGVLIAAGDTDEPRHTECSAILRDHRGGLLVTSAVVPETAWLIESRLGPAAEARFLRLIIDAELEVVELGLDDYRRCVELIETYADLGLGVVDASIVAVAERLAVTTVATLNRRDFAVVRPKHCDALTLIP